MFGRFVGNYAWDDLIDYIMPHKDTFYKLKSHLPVKENIYLFGSGREALFSILRFRRSLSNKKYVVLPGWGCPILLATITKSDFSPLLMDISLHTLKMDVREILKLNQQKEIDSVILVSENGNPYTDEEIQKLQEEGITVIADHAISWQNVLHSKKEISDFEVFSGGFSKPISGLGLGVLTTNKPILLQDDITNNRCKYNIFHILAHLILQNRFLYSMICPLVPIDLQKEYDGQLSLPTKRSVTLVLKSLERFLKIKPVWVDFQRELKLILKQRGSEAPFLHGNETILQTKVTFEKMLLKEGKKYKIEYHNQYQYDLLKDPRAVKIDSDYENIKSIRTKYIAFSINQSVLKKRDVFLSLFQNDLKKVN